MVIRELNDLLMKSCIRLRKANSKTSEIHSENMAALGRWLQVHSLRLDFKGALEEKLIISPQNEFHYKRLHVFPKLFCSFQSHWSYFVKISAAFRSFHKLPRTVVHSKTGLRGIWMASLLNQSAHLLHEASQSGDSLEVSHEWFA